VFAHYGQVASTLRCGAREWCHASIDQTLVIGARPDDEQMFLLARAAYSHEAGFWFPLTDDQFLTGIKIGMRQVAAEKGKGIHLARDVIAGRMGL
jgi:hypothetical protein